MPMKATFIVGVLIAGTVCAGQAPPKKPAQNPRAAQPSFVCPDEEARQGCKSYQELLKAKDKSLPDDGYICFRKKEDEFFVVSFTTPFFTIKPHWDVESKKMVMDEPQSVFGYAQTYKNGVLDSTTMPTFDFSGQWKQRISGSAYFIPDKLNDEKQDDKDHVDIYIDESQIIAQFKYQNPLDKTMHYTLTIQRSTGRFTESFRPESEKISFSEKIGYCVNR